MSAAEDATPVTDAEADALFADLADAPALVLAISGGPDSTALLFLLAGWRRRRAGGPRLTAITVDHGLRPEARREAAAVKRMAQSLGVAHRVMRWSGPKPATGLQEKARLARYRLLLAAARTAKAPCVLTAHTLDDQAETVLYRMARGSGLSGMSGMTRVVSLDHLLAGRGRPQGEAPSGSTRARAAAKPVLKHVALVRPLLDLEKARLIATLRAAGIPYAQDPSNDDPRFTRTRMRRILPTLSDEGLTARRFAQLARRLRRNEAAIEAMLSAIANQIGLGPQTLTLRLDRGELRQMPAEIALRLIGRAIGQVGNEGSVELGKLEALSEALTAAIADGRNGDPAGPHGRFRRTLAGAMVSLQKDCIVIERAPARGQRSGPQRAFTAVKPRD